MVAALHLGFPICPLCSGQDIFSVLFGKDQVREDLLTSSFLNAASVQMCSKLRALAQQNPPREGKDLKLHHMKKAVPLQLVLVS